MALRARTVHTFSSTCRRQRRAPTNAPHFCDPPVAGRVPGRGRSHPARYRGTGVAQTVRVGGSHHEIAVDTLPAFGGADSAPSPISYALAALVSCNQVVAQIVAKERGIRLDSFTFDASADIDTAVLVGGSFEANANFESLTLDATIRTNATPEQFAELKVETERRCPIYQLYAQSGVRINSNWHAEATS